jgi:hypothetical protein
LIGGLRGDGRCDGRSVNGQGRLSARHAVHAVADYDVEFRAVVGHARDRRRIADRYRTANVGSVFAPLIRERRGTAGRDGKRGRLTRSDRLVRRLRHDRGRHGTAGISRTGRTREAGTAGKADEAENRGGFERDENSAHEHYPQFGFRGWTQKEPNLQRGTIGIRERTNLPPCQL